jgi:putative ABC transport system permease protein
LDAKEVFTLSIDALNERKVRTLLTVLMVVVGSSLMVALNGLTAGFGTFIDDQFSNLATNVLTLSTTLTQEGGARNFGGGAPSTPKIVFNSFVVDKIRSLPFVTDVVPTYQDRITLESSGRSRDVSVLSIEHDKLLLIAPTLEFVEGSRSISNSPSTMIVADSIANPAGESSPFVIIGQTLRATYSFVDPNTGDAEEESKTFLVQAITKSTGNPIIDRAVVISQSTGNAFLHKSLRFDSIMVVTQTAEHVSIVEQEIKDLYKNNVGISTPKAILETRQQFTSGFSSFILAIAGVALVVGAVGIITTLYTSVTERTREIGIMKAIGAQNKNILFLFLSEASIIGIIGATTGILVGMVAGIVLTLGLGFGGGRTITPTFLGTDLAFVWFLSVGISIVAGIYPAWKASKLSPLIALRRD